RNQRRRPLERSVSVNAVVIVVLLGSSGARPDAGRGVRPRGLVGYGPTVARSWGKPVRCIAPGPCGGLANRAQTGSIRKYVPTARTWLRASRYTTLPGKTCCPVA